MSGEGAGEAWHTLVMSCRRDQLRQPHQIVGGGGEGEGPVDAGSPRSLVFSARRPSSSSRTPPRSVFGCAGSCHTPDGVSSARRSPSAGGWCSVPRGANVQRPQLLDEVGRVIALVRAQRDGARAVRPGLDHGERRQPLGVPETRVNRASTISPERFSISPWPMKQSFASIPGPLR